MIPRIDSGTGDSVPTRPAVRRPDLVRRFAAPASVLVALVLGFLPTARARAAIPVRSWQDLARERRGCASGSWIGAGPRRGDPLLSRPPPPPGPAGELLLDLTLPAGSPAGRAPPAAD